MENDVDNLVVLILFIKIYYGVFLNFFEEFFFFVIEGWIGIILIIKIKCFEESVLKFYVNNVIMGYLSSFLSIKLIFVIYILVFVVGALVNAVILWMFFFRIRFIFMIIFYINLVIVDFFFCVTLFFKIVYYFNGNNWVFGEVMCRVIIVIFYGNMYCFILFFVCISISRYLVIVYFFIYRGLFRRIYVLLMCVLVWVIVFLYMLLFFILK